MGKFTFYDTGIQDMFVVEPTVYGDSRGYFMETYNEEEFDRSGHALRFVQDNQSCSRYGVLRGLHMQRLHPQGKLVRVIHGEVYDVGVDLRTDSPTYGRWYGTILSEKNKRQIYVPEGFAHGFLVISEMAEFVYKCTQLYDASDEIGIRYDDEEIGIDWPDMEGALMLSEKDRGLPSYREVRKMLETW